MPDGFLPEPHDAQLEPPHNMRLTPGAVSEYRSVAQESPGTGALSYAVSEKL